MKYIGPVGLLLPAIHIFHATKRIKDASYYGVRPSHNVHNIPRPRQHHPTSPNGCDRHRVIPSLRLFSGLFHQSLLGRASTRRGTREDKIPQPVISFHRGWNMDHRFCLHSETDGQTLLVSARYVSDRRSGELH